MRSIADRLRHAQRRMLLSSVVRSQVRHSCWLQVEGRGARRSARAGFVPCCNRKGCRSALAGHAPPRNHPRHNGPASLQWLPWTDRQFPGMRAEQARMNLLADLNFGSQVQVLHRQKGFGDGGSPPHFMRLLGRQFRGQSGPSSVCETQVTLAPQLIVNPEAIFSHIDVASNLGQVAPNQG